MVSLALWGHMKACPTSLTGVDAFSCAQRLRPYICPTSPQLLGEPPCTYGGIPDRTFKQQGTKELQPDGRSALWACGARLTLRKTKHMQEKALSIISGCNHQRGPSRVTCLAELMLWKTPGFCEEHAVHLIYLCHQTENFKYCDQDAQINNLPSGPRVPKNYVDFKWLCISHSRLVIFSLLTVTMCFLTHTLTIFYFLKPQSFPNQNHALAAMCCRKAGLSKNACLGSLNTQLLLFSALCAD